MARVSAGRDDFNRPYIFSLIQSYHETDIWLFGGVCRVLQRHDDRYEVERTDDDAGFLGRLKARAISVVPRHPAQAAPHGDKRQRQTCLARQAYSTSSVILLYIPNMIAVTKSEQKEHDTIRCGIHDVT